MDIGQFKLIFKLYYDLSYNLENVKRKCWWEKFNSHVLISYYRTGIKKLFTISHNASK